MQIIIYTNQYQVELKRLAKENDICFFEKEIDRELSGEGEFKELSFALDKDDFINTKRIISRVMEDIILFKNPVTRNKENLKNNVREKVFLPFREDIENEVEKYILENNFLIVEGFINFRMKEYVNLVDLTLYSAIKKYLQ